jgi:hypothetical protein
MVSRRLLWTDAELQRFKAGKFAWVTGRAHPDASFDDLLLVGMYMSWLFVVDDLCDEEQLGWDPELLSAAHVELVDRMKALCPGHGFVLRGEGAQDFEEEGGSRGAAEAPSGRMLFLLKKRGLDELAERWTPVVSGLTEVWERMCKRAAPGWTQRFIQIFEGYAYACRWETENRATKRVPPVEEYLEFRRHTSALYVFFSLTELVEGVTLTSELLKYIHELEVRANDGVSWFNDIISLEKEVMAGDVHNLVVVLQHERGLNLQEAVNEAAQLFNDRMREYVELERGLPSFGPELDGQLQRYLKGLRCWVRGNMDWSYETGRYAKAHPFEALKLAAS